MTSKTRLANKTIWALEEIVVAAVAARKAWLRCQDLAEQRMDPVMLASLGRISDHLAQIESRARDARQGKYAE
jgi:hypothetical protein